MKYNVGYQLLGDASWIDAIVANSESVSELYFSWEDMPNGRNSTPLDDAMPSWEAQQRKVEDIGRVFDAGIRLNVLFNANCYGGKSLSRELYDRIGNAVDYLTTRFALPIATTTSPLIARFLHANFEGIEVRASVNMDIGISWRTRRRSAHTTTRILSRDSAGAIWPTGSTRSASCGIPALCGRRISGSMNSGLKARSLPPGSVETRYRSFGPMSGVSIREACWI